MSTYPTPQKGPTTIAAEMPVGGRTPDTGAPWTVESVPNEKGNRMPTWAVRGPYGATIALPGDHPHNFANARLIAAAPDLLEASLPFAITGWLNEGILKNTRADDLKIKIELEGTTYEPFFVTIGQFRSLSAAIRCATGAA
ncbi:hypothetical protein ACFPLB_10045 [Aquamicrobium segne]|uniref:Uncharacterized protein n=1 Tax=Aquamicrobium segne TaxID=469547 RepID=A0ABW0GYK4_9HYPH